ncbi:TetR family transcriptional regulator [Caulobacter sp. S45]|uniref:TetR family transcriptional regulator n=1 Tax=Caulobacter sp. S45 TaxID=1641861 RepID=UPI001576FAA5|nr:TetR family transcriptional regulator [Caulobacter sp. S45]
MSDLNPIDPADDLPPELTAAGVRPGPGSFPGDILDRAAASALELAADRPWGEISLRDIARAAGVSFAELYARADGKDALLDHLSRQADAAALASGEADESTEAHDRLFEAVMARLEAMAPHRDALIAIARAQGPLALFPRLPRTAKALLEAAGIDTGGARGALRLAGMTRVWARTLQVWRDDQGALNRTMAEIDKLLRTMNQRLGRVNAGF